MDETTLKQLGINLNVYKAMELIEENDHQGLSKLINDNPGIVKEKYKEEDDEGDEALLMKAINCGAFKCSEMLIKSGANTNLIISSVFHNRNSLLHFALKMGEFEIVRLMLQNGATVWSGDYGIDFWQYKHDERFLDEDFLTKEGYEHLINEVASGNDPVRREIPADGEYMHVFGKGLVRR